MLAQWNRK